MQIILVSNNLIENNETINIPGVIISQKENPPPNFGQ